MVKCQQRNKIKKGVSNLRQGNEESVELDGNLDKIYDTDLNVNTMTIITTLTHFYLVHNKRFHNVSLTLITLHLIRKYADCFVATGVLVAKLEKKGCK